MESELDKMAAEDRTFSIGTCSREFEVSLLILNQVALTYLLLGNAGGVWQRRRKIVNYNRFHTVEITQ